MKRPICNRLFGLACGLAALLLPLAASRAQIPATAEVVFDPLARFDPSLAADTLETQVRPDAAARGLKQAALFEHPLNTERPARVTYQMPLPSLAEGDLLLFAFDVAIADGIERSANPDGVRFEVKVGGQQLFSLPWTDNRWQSCAVDLAPFAGRTVPLELLAHGQGNTAFDWALWGNPRVLHVRRNPEARPDTHGNLPIPTGVMILDQPDPLLKGARMVPDNKIGFMQWIPPFLQPWSDAPRWSAKDFSFPQVSGVSAEWFPLEHLKSNQVWVAAYPHQVVLGRVFLPQTLVPTGQQTSIRLELRNEGRGTLRAGEGRITLQAGKTQLEPKPTPAIGPGETVVVDWDWTAPARDGLCPVAAALELPGRTNRLAASFEIFGRARPGQVHALEAGPMKLEFVRQSEGWSYARVLSRQGKDWTPVALWKPLFQFTTDTQSGEQNLEVAASRLRALPKRGEAVELNAEATDADGVKWEGSLVVTLDSNRPVARLRYEWKASQPRALRTLWGPNLHVGDGLTGSAKSQALFPGLEYLEGPEPSSNPRDFTPKLADRRVPTPDKITIPLMAVTLGPDSRKQPTNSNKFFTGDALLSQAALAAVAPAARSTPGLRSNVTVALMWNPLQKWDGQQGLPSARFASPASDDGLDNHHLGLFLPSTADLVPENTTRAAKPYLLVSNQTLALEATLAVVPGPVTTAVREWLREFGGLPQPTDWPRSFQEELDLCRTGFLQTVWDEKTMGWRHCVGWPPGPVPGFAALLWWDAQLAEAPGARQASRERFELAAKRLMDYGGPATLVSAKSAHIMQWEMPFYYGSLPEALEGLRSQVSFQLTTQEPDGGWRFRPQSERMADLGQDGDSVLGTTATPAALLLRYARITGDDQARTNGLRALEFMERFRVPRGGQTWECPLYEPDILAAAHAMRAYLEGYRLTGNPRWLQDAVYWAESGMPFLYLWTLADRPMMLGGSIPVFGSTFYTHSWLATPVQWCGLVYARNVRQLALELERTPLASTSSPLPLALGFAPGDWRRVADLILASAVHQQVPDGDLVGTYPDSITRFTQRNPAFLNPENILVNVLAQAGHDPDIKTARARTPAGAEVVVSSGAVIRDLQAVTGGARFQLDYFTDEYSHTLVTGIKPSEVRINKLVLPASPEPVRRSPGWWWDEKSRRLFLVLPHVHPTLNVEILGAGKPD